MFTGPYFSSLNSLLLLVPTAGYVFTVSCTVLLRAIIFHVLISFVSPCCL